MTSYRQERIPTITDHEQATGLLSFHTLKRPPWNLNRNTPWKWRKKGLLKPGRDCFLVTVQVTNGSNYTTAPTWFYRRAAIERVMSRPRVNWWERGEVVGELLRVKQVLRQLGITKKTLRRLERTGEIAPVPAPPGEASPRGKYYRFADVQRVAAKRAETLARLNNDSIPITEVARLTGYALKTLSDIPTAKRLGLVRDKTLVPVVSLTKATGRTWYKPTRNIRFTRKSVEALVREQEHAARPMPKGHRTVTDAAERIGMTRPGLKNWCAAGLVEAIPGDYPSGRGRAREYGYVLPEKTVTELRQLVQKNGGGRAGARRARVELLSRREKAKDQPRHEANGKPTTRGGGRPRSLADVYKFCYLEFRVKRRKRSNVLRDAQNQFGARAPKQASHVTLYAKRHIQQQRKKA